MYVHSTTEPTVLCCFEAEYLLIDCFSPSGRSLFLPKITCPFGVVGGYAMKVSHPSGVAVAVAVVVVVVVVAVRRRPCRRAAAADCDCDSWCDMFDFFCHPFLHYHAACMSEYEEYSTNLTYGRIMGFAKEGVI
jgi:hypothetical protein